MTANVDAGKEAASLILQMVTVRDGFDGPLTPGECWQLNVLSIKLQSLVDNYIRTYQPERVSDEKKTKKNISCQGPGGGQHRHGGDRCHQSADRRI